jgi:two-component system sensor histidine kinase VanS
LKEPIIKRFLLWWSIGTAAFWLPQAMLEILWRHNRLWYHIGAWAQNLWAQIWHVPGINRFLIVFVYVAATVCYAVWCMRKQSEQVRVQAQREADNLSFLAHDLKTPLTSVTGYLSLLKEEKDKKKQQEYIGIALTKARRLDELLNEFFALTRRQPKAEEEVNLTVLLYQLTDEFYPMMEERRMTLRTVIAADLKTRGDGVLLMRVFANLLKNAVNYGHEGSEILLYAADSSEGCTVRVQSHGDPIPPEQLSTMFDKHVRLDAARQSGTGGAGLGLTIARQIVEEHKGQIAASCVEGMTEITVTLRKP